MEQKIKNYLGVSLIIVAVVFSYAAIRYTESYSDSVGIGAPSFSVNGEGKVTVIPDIGQFSFNVITEGGENLADLQQENVSDVNKVMDFLKSKDISEEDIKTLSYNVRPRYQYFDCYERNGVCPPPEIVGYTIDQSVQVKVRNLEDAGDVLAGVVDNGANSVSQLSFTLDDPTSAENEARAEAIGQAKEKAKAVAEAGDFRIGRLLSVSAGSYYPTKASAYGIGGAAEDAALSSIPVAPSVEPGSEEVVVNVTLVYEIK